MILLTGGTGFLGHFIVDELVGRNLPVRVLARNPEKARGLPPEVEIVQGDILDVLSIERAMEGVEYVIHSAALVTFWKRRFASMRSINVDGTANMVNAALEAQVRKFVHVSSIAALGRPANPRRPIDEKAKWSKSKRNTEYGRTKYRAELEVMRGVAEGLPAAMVNPALILGPGRGSTGWELGSPRVFKTMAKGLRFYTPGMTGFVAVEDVAQACVELLHSKHIDGQRFVLSAENILFKEFFAGLAGELGVRPPSIKPPEGLAVMVGKFNEFKARISGKEPIVTPETIRSSTGNYAYDGSKITREIEGFSYRDIGEVVRKTARIYKEEHGN